MELNVISERPYREIMSSSNPFLNPHEIWLLLVSIEMKWITVAQTPVAVSS